MLLELKAGTNRRTSIYDDAYAQGQIDLLVEGVYPRRRLLVVEQGKVALLQIGIIVPMPVGNGKDEADLVDAEPDDRRIHIALLIGGLGRGLLRVQTSCRKRRRTQNCRNLFFYINNVLNFIKEPFINMS